jgi:hypothetical protein
MRTLIASSALAVAALLAATPGALAQSGKKAFCLQSAGGAKSCIYDTMAACEQAKRGQAQASCVRSDESTGSGSPAPK